MCIHFFSLVDTWVVPSLEKSEEISANNVEVFFLLFVFFVCVLFFG